MNIHLSLYIQTHLLLLSSPYSICLRNSRPNMIMYRLFSLGINGMTLQWFNKIYYQPTISFSISKHTSPHRKITFGVPHGSILDIFLFNSILIFEIYIYPDINFLTYVYDIHIHLSSDSIVIVSTDSIVILHQYNLKLYFLFIMLSYSCRITINLTESFFCTLPSNTLLNLSYSRLLTIYHIPNMLAYNRTSSYQWNITLVTYISRFITTYADFSSAYVTPPFPLQ